MFSDVKIDLALLNQLTCRKVIPEIGSTDTGSD